MYPSWSSAPIRMCECGHRWHDDKRCGPAQFGCPCAKATEAEEVTDPSLLTDYYQNSIRGW